MNASEANGELLAEDGSRFREFWELFKKQQRIVYFVTACALLGAWIFVQMQTPRYMARGILLIEKEGRSSMNLLNQYYAFDGDWTGEYLKTQIRVLTSRSLARKVIEELEKLPGGQGSFAAGAHPTDASRQDAVHTLAQRSRMSGAITTFLNSLNVSNIMETRLVEVTYVSTDANLAAHAVNTLFDKFIAFNLEIKAESTQQAAEFLTAQIEEMRRSLAQKERELQEYGRRKELLIIRGEDSTVVQKLADLNQAFTLAQINRINCEAMYRELKGQNYDSYAVVRDSPLIMSLKQEYSTKESEFKRKSQIFQDSYPEMQRLKTQLEGLQKRISEETADIATKALNQAEAEYQAALKKEKSLLEMLGQQRGSVVSSNANAIYYNSLKIEVQNMTNLLDFLTRKQKESMLSSRMEGIETSNIKVVDRAEIPGWPFSPNKKRTMLLALLLGFFGGIFLIYVLDYMDDSLKSPEQVQKQLSMPALGFIPDTTLSQKQSYYHPYYSQRERPPAGDRPRSIDLFNLRAPESTIAEHYRYVRTSLLLASDQPPRVMIVTSALPQEGKTATAINLAVTFAQLGKKVLVADCDLRRPRLHKIFRLKNATGLTSFLVGRCALDELVRDTAEEANLHVIPSGPVPPNPAELLTSKKMRWLLDELGKSYEFIFLDTPPLMAGSDAILLGEQGDGIILVTLGGKTPRKTIEKARDEIAKFGIKLFGVILNKLNMRKAGSGYYSYQYKYGSDNDMDEARRDK